MTEITCCKECPLMKYDSDGDAICIWNNNYLLEKDDLDYKPFICKVISASVNIDYDVKEEEGYINGHWFGKEEK